MFSGFKHSNLSYIDAIHFPSARILHITSGELDSFQGEIDSLIMVLELRALLANVFEVSKEIHLFHAIICPS